MPLHEYKTQVLLLHSEQSTLDSLSSGISDRYTVHCATTGSEALNTLVDTPINVIVTAQDLPGMSGLEALREAKKRSPDTVGILLAGNADDGLEALVGEKEVFQVVRGNVTGDEVSKLVDNATQQMRLMALAESANDTAVNVDEPAEHIVMETSENGATIISDGTGRMPALDPKKVSAAAAVGAQSVDVLVLTKDQEFLATIKDSSRGMHTVHYATTLAQADETVRKHKVGVAVVDAAMVGDKVEQLTQHLRKGSPRLVSIVAGRRDDGEMLMDLINRGKVYRFLLKPVSPGRARLAVEASVKHHLEAPDSAFKMKAGAAATPAAKPPKPAKAEPKPEAPKARKAKKAAKPAMPEPVVVKADPPLERPAGAAAAPVDDRLDTAFGDDDSSFTETVTGLITSVGKKFSKKDGESEPDIPAVAATTIDSGGPSLDKVKMIGIGAAAVVVLAGLLFWFMGDSEEPAPSVEQAAVEEPQLEEVSDVSAPSITEADVGASAPVDDAPDTRALLDEARLARDAGQIYNPPGNNAIELYAAAVSAGNAEAELEFADIIDEALALAETALLEDRLGDADAALQRVAFADPDNARLPFLTAQLAQAQLRGYLGDARTAILEERFEDAASALGAARLLDVPDTTEVALVEAELESARTAQQADEVLALANARLEEGDLLSPPNDNARYYYELVLSNDPQNPAARQGLTVVANKLVLLARSEIDSNNFAAAEALLSDARAVDPNNAEVTAAAGALVSAQDALAEQRRQAEARAEAERLAAEARAEAERLAAEKAAAEQAAAERLAAEQAAAEKLAAEQAAAEKLAAEQAAAEKAAAERLAAERTAAEQSAGAAPGDAVAAAGAAAALDGTGAAGGDSLTPSDSGAAAPGGSNVAAEPQATQPAATGPTPTSISALNRIKYVAPKYPRIAERRNLSGWVDIVFTVAGDGTVKDIEIRDSQPGETFVNAAIRAVERWEFEPVVENGVVVEKRAGVRMMFALE